MTKYYLAVSTSRTEALHRTKVARISDRSKGNYLPALATARAAHCSFRILVRIRIEKKDVTVAAPSPQATSHPSKVNEPKQANARTLKRIKLKPVPQ